MKNILVILDGCSGNPKIERTAFEVAHTPNLDYFAYYGKTGLLYPAGKKIAPESDVGILGILGYDPFKYHTGRGPLEALGMDIKLPKAWLALRANFATIKNDEIIERRSGRNLSTKEARKLAKDINEKINLDVPFKFFNSIEHRGVLLLEGNLSDKITNTDPAYTRKGLSGIVSIKKDNKIKKCKPLNNNFITRKTALIINDFTNKAIEILRDHKVNKKRAKQGKLPANVILLRDAGNKLPDLPKIDNWLAILSMPLEKGIAIVAGMNVITIKQRQHGNKEYYQEIKKDLYNNCKRFRKALFRNWDIYDNFYIHFKEPDIAGHDGKREEKKEMIEIIDKEFFSYLKNKAYFNLLVTCDHATPTKLKSHSDDPVPVLLFGKGMDLTSRFTERDCKHGSLGLIKNASVLKLL